MKRSVRRPAGVGAVGMLLTAASWLVLAAPAGALMPVRPPVPPPRPRLSAAFSWQLQTLPADSSGAVQETNYDTTEESTTSPVVLNACASSAPAGIASYRWLIGDNGAVITSSCITTWTRPVSHLSRTTAVTLTVIPTGAYRPVSVTNVIRYQDVVIASLGDSAASGEGAPQDAPPGSDAQWSAKYCGRSGWAASAQAALSVQRSLPDTTVHFWHLTCAGAAITSDDSQPWWDPQHPDGSYFGGLLTPFQGTYGNHHLPPQLDRMRTLQQETGLVADKLLLTIGANETHWATVAEWCLPDGLDPTGIAQFACVQKNAQKVVDAVNTLPGHFAALQQRMQIELPTIPADRIYLTGYFDPLDSLSPQPPECPNEPLVKPYLKEWAGAVVENPLQEAVKTAAGNYHWQYVDGIRQAFQGHGVCQLFSSWINATLASISTQGDVYGTWHANRTGQMVVASIVSERSAPLLWLLQCRRSPSRPTPAICG